MARDSMTMGPPGPREAIADAIASLGCAFQVGPGGRTLLVACPSHMARARLLNAGAEHDARYDPRIRKLAVQLARAAPTDARGKVDQLGLARAIHAAVIGRVRFLDEGAETFETAWNTWSSGVGDCDDVSRLLLALYRSVGIDARLIVLEKSEPGAADILPTHATVAVVVGGKRYWAEASVRGARFGEEPRAAARRLGAGRTELSTSDLRGIAPAGAERAFRIIRAVWPTELLPASPFAVSYAVAWSRIDGAWGMDPTMPNNWGAVHCSARPDAGGACAAGCVPKVDHFADGRPYVTCFKAYPSPEDGARDFLRQLVGPRPLTRERLREGRSVENVVQAMRDEHYFGGFCPKASAKGYGQNSAQCNAEVVETSAATLRRLSAENSAAAGEVDGFEVPGEPMIDPRPSKATPYVACGAVLVAAYALWRYA